MAILAKTQKWYEGKSENPAATTPLPPSWERGLSAGLRDKGCKTLHAEGDADLPLTGCDLTYRRGHGPSGSALFWHAAANLHPLYFKSEEKQACKKTECGMLIT